MHYNVDDFNDGPDLNTVCQFDLQNKTESLTRFELSLSAFKFQVSKGIDMNRSNGRNDSYGESDSTIIGHGTVT